MTPEERAILGTFCDYKLIKTRKVLQLHIEVPLEQQAQVFAALGFPTGGDDIWVALARLDPAVAQVAPAAPETPGKRFEELKLVQQAGIRCADERFWEFLRSYTGRQALNEEEAAAQVRVYCQVGSRRELDENEAAGRDWREMNENFEIYAGIRAEPHG